MDVPDGERYSGRREALGARARSFSAGKSADWIVENSSGFTRKVPYNPRLHLGQKPEVELVEYVRLPVNSERRYPEIHMVATEGLRVASASASDRRCARIGYEAPDGPNRAA